MFELKKYRGVNFSTLESDAKFEEKLICQFKIDARNLTNFDSSTQNTQKVTLKWVAFDKSICLSLESTEELYLMALTIDATFDGKLTCASKNDMINLANFHQSTQKSELLDFDEILLSKVEDV